MFLCIDVGLNTLSAKLFSQTLPNEHTTAKHKWMDGWMDPLLIPLGKLFGHIAGCATGIYCEPYTMKKFAHNGD